ncbi:MAG: MOP flippase family protein [Gallionella sp.]|nr:MOP flippase family protein [Gallionella sp.]
MTLKHKTFSAVRWTTTSAVARAVLQIVQVAVLARLLTPEDYGLIAMVGVVLSFAGLFADLGVNSAFVQCQNVTLEQRASLFWFNVALGAGLSFLLIAASPLLAWFFGDERLTPLLMLSASTFVIGSLGQQVRMAAEKELDFRAIVLLEITAAALGFILALLTAVSGWGVYSIVFGGIVSAIFGTTFAWMYLARGWRPMWRLRIEDVRPFLGFGGAMLANNIVNQFNMAIDLFLGGRLLGAAQLGLYSVPRNLVLQLQFMVNPIITRVGFPLIAQIQNDVVRVRAIYLKTLNMTASTNAPLYVGIAVFAPEIVAALLGDGWQGSAPLLRILAVWGFFRSTGNPAGSLLFGMGRADLALKWNVTLLLIVPPVMWVGSQFGPAGLAWALLGFSFFMYIPGWYFLVRPLCQAGIYEYSVAVLRPFLLALLSMVPAYLIAGRLDGVIVRLSVAVMISASLYLAISYKANREWFSAMAELLWHRRVSK